MHILNDWLQGARTCHSPNFDDRPDERDISLIVIHCISLPPGEFITDNVDLLFTNRLPPDAHPYFEKIYRNKVSAHFLISRDGSVTQYVALNKRAWHAGVSEYCGRQRCNDFSVGIELEGAEDVPYTEPQYDRLARLLAILIGHYPSLTADRIAGHSDIAPERKTDPGPSFDWQKLFRLLKSQSN
ncbi:MAG: 1,6-anhydro-N-acetylmuramyl-L-alanine amidase AmpD [Gammaproteobacteria bacterium]